MFKKIEVWLLIAMGMTSVYRFMHFPWSGWLSKIILISVALLFALGGIIFYTYKVEGAKKASAFFLGLAVSATSLTLLFKLNLWSGSLFIAAVALVFVSASIFFAFRSYAKTPAETAFIALVIARSFVLSTFLALCMWMSNSFLISFYYADDPVRVSLMKQLEQSPNDEETKQQLKEHLQEQRKLEHQLKKP